MKIHPRTILVAAAERDFNNFLLDWHEKHQLTSIEETQIFSRQIQSLLKYMLRHERHPNNDKGADEA